MKKDPPKEGEEKKQCYLTKCHNTKNRKKACEENLNYYDILNESGKRWKKADWEKKWKEYNCEGSITQPKGAKGSGGGKGVCAGAQKRALCMKKDPPKEGEKRRCYLTKCKLDKNRKADCKKILGHYDVIDTSRKAKNANWEIKWNDNNCKGTIQKYDKGYRCPVGRERMLCKNKEQPTNTEPPTTEPPTTEAPTTTESGGGEPAPTRKPGQQKLLSDLIFDHVNTDSTL